MTKTTTLEGCILFKSIGWLTSPLKEQLTLLGCSEIRQSGKYIEFTYNYEVECDNIAYYRGDEAIYSDDVVTVLREEMQRELERKASELYSIIENFLPDVEVTYIGVEEL